MAVKIAMVQPKTHAGPDEAEINISRAEQYIDEAASLGARLVCFPESYPGPWKESNIYSPKERISAKAAERNVYVICGDLEPAPNGYYNIFWFFGPDGVTIGKYRRSIPKGPWMYRGGKRWDFEYVEAPDGETLKVYDTEFGKVGILMCTEVYCSELARVLALQGAEMLFMPAGITRPPLWETWDTLIKARAYENDAYVATCRNMFDGDDAGFCVVAGPEGPLFQSNLPGVHIVEFDLERLRWLRGQEESRRHKLLPFAAKPFELLTQWRRPELYGALTKKGS